MSGWLGWPFDRLRANGLPGPAPLDSCLRRNDAMGCAGTPRDGDAPAPRPCPGFPLSRERRGGVRAGRRCWWRRGGGSRWGGAALREPQGDRNRESPLRRGVGVGDAMAVWSGGAPPLWIPAFAGMTSGGSGCDEKRRRPRDAPLPWVPAFARTTVGECGPAGAAGGEGFPALAGRAFRERPLRRGVGCVRDATGVGSAGAAPGARFRAFL